MAAGGVTSLPRSPQPAAIAADRAARPIAVAHEVQRRLTAEV